MNAVSHTDFAPFRIVSGPICGGLLGPEWIVFAADKYFRIGQPSLTQLERGALVEEMDMLECSEDGEPIE